MIIDINEKTINQIKNPVTRVYANSYVEIYKDFMDQINSIGLEVEENDTTELTTQKTQSLREKGAVVRNNEYSIYNTRISPSCVACQTAQDTSTFFISLKCHRDCFYCFNPNQENYEFHTNNKRDVVAELEELYKTNPKMKHLALTGGEPLLYKEQTYTFFDHARELFPAAHTRLYTSGDHIDPETLAALRDAGLKEIRFSIRMHDLAAGRRHTYDRIEIAKEYIQNVMVEMPILPNTLDEMKEILLELDRMGIFGINLLEFCFPLNNVEIYREKGYKIKARPFRVLYDYWYAGGLPIAGSEQVCLDLMDFAMEKGLKLGVHYCSLENKHTGQLYQQNNQPNLPKRMRVSHKDYFIKTAKVFGEDIPLVQDALSRAGYKDQIYNENDNSLEFNVDQIGKLKKLDIEIGISSSVIETRDDGPIVRELKVDLTTPQTFRMSKDI